MKFTLQFQRHVSVPQLIKATHKILSRSYLGAIPKIFA